MNFKETARVGPDCLAAESFAAYLEGGLTETERNSVEEHLVGCAACREELAVSLDRLSVVAQSLQSTPPRLLQRALDLARRPEIQDEDGEAALEIVVRWVKDSLELVRTSGQRVFAPAPQPVRRGRSADRAGPLQIEKKIGEFDVAVEMEKVEDGLLQIIVRVTKNLQPADGIRVTLFSGSREQASFVTKRGEVLFDRIPPGVYRLAIFDGGSPVGKIRLKVEGDRHE